MQSGHLVQLPVVRLNPLLGFKQLDLILRAVLAVRLRALFSEVVVAWCALLRNLYGLLQRFLLVGVAGICRAAIFGVRSGGKGL